MTIKTGFSVREKDQKASFQKPLRELISTLILETFMGPCSRFEEFLLALGKPEKVPFSAVKTPLHALTETFPSWVGQAEHELREKFYLFEVAHLEPYYCEQIMLGAVQTGLLSSGQSIAHHFQHLGMVIREDVLPLIDEHVRHFIEECTIRITLVRDLAMTLGVSTEFLADTEVKLMTALSPLLYDQECRSAIRQRLTEKSSNPFVTCPQLRQIYAHMYAWQAARATLSHIPSIASLSG